MGLVTATKAFCKLLFDRELSELFEKLVAESHSPRLEQPQESPARVAKSPVESTPSRSEAITLIAALQREARFLDLVKESLDEYSDEQVGAASRDVLRDSGKVLDRMFGVVRLTEADDGSEMETPATFDPAEYRLTGNVTGEAPFRGTVAHHGWKATRCEIPTWSGDRSASMILAPVELEIS